MEAKTLKGVKNFGPEEQILREDTISQVKKTLETYGFSPIETPILQSYSLLSSKYGGGEEILKECYKLKDQGNRKLGLRYELTITLAEFILENSNLKIPFKRYEIGKVFRDGPVKKSRAREFTQVDFDIVGTSSELAELEVMAIYNEVFKNLNLDVEIQINSRKILIGILEYASIQNKVSVQNSVILTLDKLDKIGETGVREELSGKGLKKSQIDKIFEVMGLKGTNKELLSKLSKFLTSETSKEGLSELEKLFSLLEIYKIDNVVFLPSLARGLNYYTGITYEVFLKNRKTNSSLAAGGRYDNLISKIASRELPSIGGSFGVDAISSVLEPQRLSRVQLYLIPIGLTEKEFLPLIRKLREKLNVDFDLSGRGISKSLDYANKNKIPFCAILGKKELGEGKIKLKNMASGEEFNLKPEEIFDKIKA